ncbi:MAG: hypothetical protein LBB24_03550 [Rickettsiales bacterium]|jgi:hypothetical protein|nr:hypothetical protein [Rickettsiales bacterium]
MRKLFFLTVIVPLLIAGSSFASSEYEISKVKDNISELDRAVIQPFRSFGSYGAAHVDSSLSPNYFTSADSWLRAVRQERDRQASKLKDMKNELKKTSGGSTGSSDDICIVQ